ncbi:MAG: S-adenosylmethionine:tRNA ribosyltransferase-isomerase [Candidatus Shikimatogenerans sp. AspAUS03]|uniref:S-adenosylmethionine:tRNA ribosyltransferase-isomerase n=1 Tax=Candidatus Shikimatogenerans sp. AspAUS03 TaxID=3158563 RepID=A0AAU7QT02_9FLAO
MKLFNKKQIKILKNNIINKNNITKLFIFNCQKKKIIHDYFKNIYKYLKKNSLFIYNDINVKKSVLIGKKKNSKIKIKIIFIKKINKLNKLWEVFIIPNKKIRLNNIINFYYKKHKILKIKIIDNNNLEEKIAKIIYQKYKLKQILKKIGKIYYPFYIKKKKNIKLNKFIHTNLKKKSIYFTGENLKFNNKIYLKLLLKKIKPINITSYLNKNYFNEFKKNEINNYILNTEKFKIKKKYKNKIIKYKKKKKYIYCLSLNILKIINNIIYYNKIKKIKNNKWNILCLKFKKKNIIINNLITIFENINTINYYYFNKFLKFNNINIKTIYKIAKKHKYKFGIFGDIFLFINK